MRIWEQGNERTERRENTMSKECDELDERLHAADAPWVVRCQEMRLLARRLERQLDELREAIGNLGAAYARLMECLEKGGGR
jgi:hypothetical protein